MIKINDSTASQELCENCKGSGNLLVETPIQGVFNKEMCGICHGTGYKSGE